PVRAISGQRSLLVPAYARGARATLRLRVSPGQKVVRAAVRAIFDPDGASPFAGPAITALAADGSTTHALNDPPALPFAPFDNATVIAAPQSLAFPLPAGARDEVLIDVYIPPAFSELDSPIGGMLIDDLHLE